MAATIATRILILSDTHGEELIHSIPSEEYMDVVIHCGDMTDESTLKEYHTAIQTLRNIKAPLKLVIPGNHDFSLDEDAFQNHLSEAHERINDDQLLEKTYGKVGDARALFTAEDNIILLDEGIHHFDLKNGAHLTVYASPYTASKSTGWGYSYDPDQQEHEWNIKPGVDLVMTHSPPKGMLDYTDTRVRAGISSLFEAVAQAKPKVHCFGHIHEAWGGKLVAWREQIPDAPSHFTAIDNGKSRVIERKFDVIDEERLVKYQAKGYREIDDVKIGQSEQTLFVNAAIEGSKEGQQQLPWMLNIQLPQSQLISSEGNKKRSRSADVDGETETSCKRPKE